MDKLEEKVDKLIKDMQELKSSIRRIEKGDITVPVKTIGKEPQPWMLKDIIQTLWDRPKDTFDRIADYSGKSSKIISFLKTITMLIISIMVIIMFFYTVIGK